MKKMMTESDKELFNKRIGANNEIEFNKDGL